MLKEPWNCTGCSIDNNNNADNSGSNKWDKARNKKQKLILKVFLYVFCLCYIWKGRDGALRNIPNSSESDFGSFRAMQFLFQPGRRQDPTAAKMESDFSELLFQVVGCLPRISSHSCPANTTKVRWDSSWAGISKTWASPRGRLRETIVFNDARLTPDILLLILSLLTCCHHTRSSNPRHQRPNGDKRHRYSSGTSDMGHNVSVKNGMMWMQPGGHLNWQWNSSAQQSRKLDKLITGIPSASCIILMTPSSCGPMAWESWNNFPKLCRRDWHFTPRINYERAVQNRYVEREWNWTHGNQWSTGLTFCFGISLAVGFLVCRWKLPVGRD